MNCKSRYERNGAVYFHCLHTSKAHLAGRANSMQMAQPMSKLRASHGGPNSFCGLLPNRRIDSTTHRKEGAL